MMREYRRDCSLVSLNESWTAVNNCSGSGISSATWLRSKRSVVRILALRSGDRKRSYKSLRTMSDWMFHVLPPRLILNSVMGGRLDGYWIYVAAEPSFCAGGKTLGAVS